MARNTKGYKFDFAHKTIIMTKTFYKEACKPGTDENTEMLALQEKHPDFKFISKSARIQKQTRPDKGLSFANMEAYISTYKNAEELLEIFNTVKARAKVTASSKKYVTDWFKAQFPDYNKPMDVTNIIAFPVAIPDTANYKPKAQELPEVAEG